ncbi:glutathione S-transferase 3-like isoform X3 [Acanthopagrus latus]|uniref:glutathione S-transferase 3-like isoform X3 n=1 Tax=Acanthopagrus latus TaxID=8177 RepID=UPI00187C4C2D|nr:glutathione S-transferase 3-like isoform X3 [Acanthopagrus latus]
MYRTKSQSFPMMSSAKMLMTHFFIGRNQPIKIMRCPTPPSAFSLVLQHYITTLTSPSLSTTPGFLYGSHNSQQFHRFNLQNTSVMAGKVVLHYFNGRGKMESIRWLLTVAEVDFEEVHLTTHDQYQKLLSDGHLMFQQVPMVEIDGMKLIQTKAILQYIAEKYNLHGKDIKDRVMINMYTEGLMDLMEMIMMLPFTADPKPKLDNIQAKATERYLPVFEKVLSGQIYLVGGKLSVADVLLLECTLMLEEKFVGILGGFPNVKAFQGRMTRIPAIDRFLKPGSKRKPQPDDQYVKTVMEVFDIKSLP